jgi:hypothetical protein
MLGAGKDGCESVPIALSVVSRQFAEDTFAVFPQDL